MVSRYNDPAFPASFSGVERVFKTAKSLDPTKTRESVKKDLQAVDSYTLHKPVRKPTLYRRTITHGIDYLYQCDLVDLIKYSRVNDGFKYIITIIDCFSKKAWAFKLKTKTGKAIVDVMTPFFKNNKPKKIQFDQGTEFYNKLFLSLLRKLKIHHYSVYSDKKAAIVERFNRTLKTRMFRHFTASGSYRWVDALQNLIDGYNKTEHSSTTFAPNEVNKRNENLVRMILFPKVKKTKAHSKPAFKVGDSVRITRKKSIFQKGYEQTYSHEVFTVHAIKPTYPVTYELRDYKGDVIKGSFYKSEIQRVDKSDNVWPIEKVVRSRKRAGKTEFLVKWVGYPDEANSWIPQSELFNI